MAELRLEVVTPERTVTQTVAESIVVPGAEGRLGFLPGHAPLVAGLTIGIVEYGPAHGQKKRLAITGGFVEVADDKVAVLADTAELADEIDVARAQAAKERAERRLRERQDDIDRTRAEVALRRAINRLKTAGPA